MPGDIVLWTTGEIRAKVDEKGGRPLAVGVYRLRVDAEQLNPVYVAQGLAGDWNKRHQMGVSVNRADARDLEIPLIPIQEQNAVADALSQAEDEARWARAITQVLVWYQQKLMDVIRHGLAIEKPEEL